MDRAGQMALNLVGDPDAETSDFSTLSSKTSEQTPLSVYQSIYAVLQDDHTRLFPLALAMLRPKLTKKLAEGLQRPAITGLTEDQARTALIELWLWQAMRKHAIRLQHTPDNVEGARALGG